MAAKSPSSSGVGARVMLHGTPLGLYRDAWMGDDPVAVASLYAPAGERCEVGFERSLRGRSEIEAAAGELMQAFGERRLAVDPVMVDDFGWVAALTWSAVQRAPFRGSPASHRWFQIPGLTVARLEGGLLVRERWYFDGLAVMRLLGGRL
jgi:SnoaL-like polyketide cyclase